MTTCTSEYIQLQDTHPSTNFIIYEGEKYPINFGVLKNSSKFFYELRHEINENDIIDLNKYETEDNITHKTREEVIDFIKYIQLKPIKITNENIIALQHFGHKYEIEQLITSTEEYIKQHLEEVLIKFLQSKEHQTYQESSLYEDEIARNFSKYVNNDDIYEVDISTLYRILGKATKYKEEYKDECKDDDDDDDGKDKESEHCKEGIIDGAQLKDFLMRILRKRGRSASILFKYLDIEQVDEEMLRELVREHSANFEFEFITASVMKVFLEQKKKIEEERQEVKKREFKLQHKCEKLENELKTAKSEHESTKTKLEEEVHEVKKREEELQHKYENLENELKTTKSEHESTRIKLEEEVSKYKGEEEEKQKEKEEATSISISKYGPHLIISNEGIKRKYEYLIEYFLKEGDKIMRNTADEGEATRLIFIEPKTNTSTNTNDERIFISHTMIEMMYVNHTMNITELKKGLEPFTEIYFELEYGKNNFSSLYSRVIEMKHKNELLNNVKVSILYEGVENAESRFENNKEIDMIRIGSGVKNIKESAFRGCSSLTSVSIPSSVTSIGYCAFSGCSSLTSVSIPSSVTSIGSYAFSGCSSLRSVSIPSSVTSIGSCAFQRCSSLRSVSIPSSVTSIGSFAFDGCSSLTSVSIPSSVTSIGECIFGGCTKLNDIKVVPLKEERIKYIENKFLVFKSKFEKDIYDILLWVNRNNETIKVPEFIKRIGGGAFIECSSLTSVSIPSSVTSIGDSAFYGCSSLTSVSIPSSVTSIENSAFYGCSSLTSISIPSSVTSIGSYAFSGCSSLTSVSIPSSVTSIGNSAFDGCSSLTSVSIPSSVTSIGSCAFQGCSSLTSISIPSSVTSIGSYAFQGCSSLTSISIPSSVASIGYSAFYGCSSLTSVSIPSSVTSIGSCAFSGCSSLTSVSIPKSININNIGIQQGVKITNT